MPHLGGKDADEAHFPPHVSWKEAGILLKPHANLLDFERIEVAGLLKGFGAEKLLHEGRFGIQESA